MSSNEPAGSRSSGFAKVYGGVGPATALTTALDHDIGMQPTSTDFCISNSDRVGYFDSNYMPDRIDCSARTESDKERRDRLSRDENKRAQQARSGKKKRFF